jgi:hypothetical protein
MIYLPANHPVFFYSYARHLGKFRQVKSAEAAAAAANRLQPQPRIITTAGSRQRKIVRKYVKNDRGLAGLQTRKAAAVAATPPPEPPTPVPVAMSSPPGRSVARRLGKKADAELLLKGPTLVRLSNCIREKTAAAAAVPVSPAASPRTPMSRLENPYSKQFNTSSSRRKRQASSTDDCSSSDTGGGGQSPAVMSSGGGKTPAASSSGGKSPAVSSSGGKSPAVSSSGGKSPAVLSGDGTPNLSPEAKKARKEISGVTPIRTPTERYHMCVPKCVCQ